MDKFKMISFSAFFYSFGIAILSLSQVFLTIQNLKIFGRHQESNPGPLV